MATIQEQGGIAPWPKPADGQLVPRIGRKSVGVSELQRKDKPVEEPED